MGESETSERQQVYRKRPMIASWGHKFRISCTTCIMYSKDYQQLDPIGEVWGKVRISWEPFCPWVLYQMITPEFESRTYNFYGMRLQWARGVAGSQRPVLCVDDGCAQRGQKTHLFQ
jgi:hypothetical protein